MANLLRIDLVISGKVQGVGYRYFLKNKAESLGIRGFVRNERNGSVFAAIQGKSDDLENLVISCYKGPPNSVVKNIERILKPLEDFREFRIDF